jgi:cytochrome c biogenesis protein CcmG/thiol:disulfide interchange protein DsbE
VVLTLLVAAPVYVDLASPTTGVVDPLVNRTHLAATDFSLPYLGTPGRRLSLASLRGKPLVLDFWASWCTACQAEMPLLEAAYRSGRGAVRFLGVDTDDNRQAALRFVARTGVTYPSLVLSDPASPVVTSYGLIGLPVTYFISSKGRVMGCHIGQMNAATLSAAINLAFGRSPSA